MARLDRCASAYLLPEPWPPRALARGGFFLLGRRLLGRLRETVADRQFACHPPDKADQHLDDSGQSRAWFAQRCVEIDSAAYLHLHRMKAASRGAMPVEHIAAEIRPVVPSRAAYGRQLVDGRGREIPVVRGPESVADDELGSGILAALRSERRHRVQIDQQGRPPAIA